MWSELMQFADRQFYRDWWNSNSFAEYYRNWNGVVYDWLYSHVYLDAVAFLESRNYAKSTAKTLAALFVIEVSALIHEHIIACAFGFWFPVLLFMYGGPGVLFSFISGRGRKSGRNNIFVWGMLLIGFGLMISLYAREFYIRQQYVKPYPVL
ncbi:Sterol O-acyltransferase 1, partial [Quaeritorhiza haematococci]